MKVKHVAALAALAASGLAFAQVPAGYPADYAQVIAAAKKEGKVVVYSALDTKAAQPLIKDFNALYPDVKVEYNDMNSTEMYNRFIAEQAAGQGGADVMWSSAMDLQVKLVDEGHAMPYQSVEAKAIPQWANYKNMAYGTTYEPAAIIYNKRLVAGDQIPTDHASLVKILAANVDKFKGKVTTYDIEKSGVGFMFAVQDFKFFPQMDDLVRAFGKTQYKVYSSTGNMLEKTSSGEHLIGYNVLGSYALARAEKDQGLGVVMPKDFTLVLSRVIFIGKGAKQPNAAKLWLDYVLSKRGQKVIGDQCQLFSMRDDVEGNNTAAALKKRYGDHLKPIPVDSEITQYLDPRKRLDFLNHWKQLLQGK